MEESQSLAPSGETVQQIRSRAVYVGSVPALPLLPGCAYTTRIGQA